MFANHAYYMGLQLGLCGSRSCVRIIWTCCCCLSFHQTAWLGYWRTKLCYVSRNQHSWHRNFTRTVLSYLMKIFFKYFLEFSIDLSTLLLLNPKQASRSAGYRRLSLIIQWSLYFHTARLNSHSHVLWIHLDPRFSQSPLDKAVN